MLCSGCLVPDLRVTVIDTNGTETYSFDEDDLDGDDDFEEGWIDVALLREETVV